MSAPAFTKAELKDFDLLTARTGSRDQVTRILARSQLKAFVASHGKEKCDAMFAELTKKAERQKK